MKNDILEALNSGVEQQQQQKVTLRDAKYPLFDESNVFLRASIAVILGCDVFVQGVNGLGPSKISEKIAKWRNNKAKYKNDFDIIWRLQEWACSRGKIKPSIFDTYVKALVFEPANEVTVNGEEVVFEDENQSDFVHIHGDIPPPDDFPQYLEDFSFSCFGQKEQGTNTSATEQEQNDDKTILGSDLFYCIGSTTSHICKDQCHIVLKEEIGVIKCSKCGCFVCHSCNKNGKCLPCYSDEVIIVPETNDMADGEGTNPGRPACSINEMAQILRGENYELDASAMPDEIEEIFDAYITSKKLAGVAEDHLDKIAFPIFPASTVDEIKNQSNTSTKFKVLSTIDFSEGGQFIANKSDLPDHLLPSVLELLGTLVQYKPIVEKHTKFDHKIYKALPSIFIHFANKSCHDSGYRLLRRCARHAMDPRTKCLTGTEGKIFSTEDGSIGMLLSSVIPASMKKDEYNTSVAFTAKDLLSCQCSCKCGGEGSESIVCVHVLPLIFLLSLLLTEGLAENILLELCARYQAVNEQQMENGMREAMKKYINVLMLASGDEELDTNKSICDILSIFQVGTQKRKETIVGTPDPSLIGPIIDLPITSLISSEQAAMTRMKRSRKISCELVKETSNKTKYKRFCFSDEDQGDNFGCFKSIPCMTCYSGIPTSHRCEICGSAFCIICTEKWGTEGNRTRCGDHLGIVIDEDENGVEDGTNNGVEESVPDGAEERMGDEKQENETISYPNFEPDYVRVQMMIELLKKNNDETDNQNIIGLLLLDH